MGSTETLTWNLLKQEPGFCRNCDMDPLEGRHHSTSPPPQPHIFPLNLSLTSPSLSSPPLPSLPLPLFGGCAGKNREPDDDGPSQVLRRGVRVTNRRTRCGLVSRWTCMPAS
ncbi:unnamed protein product [Gadus morhua 'NCC']